MSVSAFIVSVPEAESCVGALRARFDPSAPLGVPAHITVLHPFMAPALVTDEVLAKVLSITASSAPFRYRLAAIRAFPGTLYLAPEPAAPFVELTLRLARAFPEYPPYAGVHEDVVPHLSVAQGAASADAEVLAALGAALPPEGVTASCSELALIENTSGRWLPMHVFALAAAR